MPGNSESQAGYGSMPESMFFRKMEQTCGVFEDPDQLNNYYRASLKDMRPDAPSLESDFKRERTYAPDFLNLRHGGARVLTEPSLPDGTFLDFQALERDPRGNALDPDLKQYRKQHEARNKFIKFYADGDNSVPGEGVSPQTMIKNIKGQFYNVKSRMKIFEDSLTGQYRSGAVGNNIMTPKECMQRVDARAPEMQDEVCGTRANKQHDLSNNTSVGWRRTTDNMFQVAKYNEIRKVRQIVDDNYTKNRENALIDNDIIVSFKDQNVAKSVALKMIDLSKKRYSDMLNGKNIAMEESKHQKIRTQKLSSTDLSAMECRPTDQTQPAAPNVMLNGAMTQHVTGKSTKPRLDSNRLRKSDVSPFIAKYMASVNRKMTTKALDDLRNTIERSAEFTGLLNVQANKVANQQDPNNELLWESVANFERGKDMKVANYSNTMTSTVLSNPKNQRDLDFEAYKRDQKLSGQRRGNISNPSMYNMDTIDYDQAAGMEAVGTKLIGSMGNKYMRGHMDRGDTEQIAMGEVSARN